MTGVERRHVVVAMSGGVDSSVAAALLLQQGYLVRGVTLRLWTPPNRGQFVGAQDASESLVADARQVCTHLGISHEVVDLRAQFRTVVVDDFCEQYALGRTPNPCLTCNPRIKFGVLLQLALQTGADWLVTGHYARVVRAGGEYRLLKGVDRSKDQSYVLYRLGQYELAHVLFPLGAYSKSQVRALAAQWGLPTATKSESQDACFLVGADYRGFVASERPETVRPGPILDRAGQVLGQHRGVAFYTVGQRQGLGIAARQPLYVLELDVARNALIVGPREALLQKEALAEQVSFVSGQPPAEPVPVTAKIRYKAPEAHATLYPLPQQAARVAFELPQPAVTPGQGIVFYQDQVVLGGGIIAAHQMAV